MNGAGRWVLLRGLMRDSRHWGDFPQQLRQRFPGTAVETVDLPGNGARFRERSPARVDAMVAACRRDLGERGIAPPYRLLAMSLGAMVAADWLSRHPAEIGACVLINTSLRPYARFYQRLRPIAYAPLLRLLLTHPDERTVERTILHLTSARTDEDRMLDSWVAWRRSHPVSSGNTLRQLLAAARYRARREAPRMPVLLLAGGRDRLVDPRCSQRLAAAWHCRLAVHPDAGHDLPLDDGAWVLQQIDAWCRDLGIARAAHHERQHDRQND